MEREKNEKQTIKKNQTGIHIEEKKMYNGKMVRVAEHIQEHKEFLFAIIEFKQTPIGQNRIEQNRLETSGLSGEETTTGLPLSDISLMLR